MYFKKYLNGFVKIGWSRHSEEMHIQNSKSHDEAQFDNTYNMIINLI